MIAQGAILAVIGIGVVFMFLLLMIGAMSVLGIVMKPLARLIPEPEEKIAEKTEALADDHTDIAIAIAAVYSANKAEEKNGQK